MSRPSARDNSRPHRGQATWLTRKIGTPNPAVNAFGQSGNRRGCVDWLVDTWGMTGNIDSFRRGATAFRNARDWAKQHRDNVIREANATASQARIAAAQADATGPHEDDISTPHEPHELHEPVDPAQYITLQDADGEPALLSIQFN
ncbi:hypothetical protein B0J13DRAFT_661681 [Dactylonectria estremocensis]|uniref:Uncharacterized protein n=1 Tax=Dactylonectria estremocensis TaxID=1079267 RepID=A0A9P9D156_9HYPO|nr:hypothetical protein B0J13DRAFT_661681 [Dactylonectria estremocensis]